MHNYKQDEITKEQLENDMYNLKLSQDQISKKYNLHCTIIRRVQDKFGLEILNLQQRRVPNELTNEQKQLVYGTIIADGHIFRKNDKRNGALKICHSIKQKEYFEYKYNILKDFVRQKPSNQVSSVKYINKDGEVKNSTSYSISFRTLTHPFFTEVHNAIYKVNDMNEYQKHLTSEILNNINELGLAIAYMDDGTKHHRERDFCFECYSYEEQELFCKWLKEKFNLDARIIKYCKRNRVRIIRSSVNRFIEIIKPFIIKSMLYKV